MSGILALGNTAITVHISSNGGKVPMTETNEHPELPGVDPDRRVELTRFETEQGDEAEIACGLLRANGIACELSSTALPGLPADLIIWINPEDAKQAQMLLEDAQRSAPREEDEAA
jgi:hypothetical protein